jgi:RNA polymerase sigma-70 factor (ECF subfamily)
LFHACNGENRWTGAHVARPFFAEEDVVESELIASVRAGNQDAFAPLMDAYQAAIHNLCYRMLGDAREAEDAAQETFLRAYSQLHRYDPARPFKTWLFAIASHHCIDRLRKRRWRWLSLDDELLAEREMWHAAMPDPEEVALSHERRDEVAALLARLAPQDRAAIVLHYWCDLSYAEIAAVIGVSVSAVKSRLHRARVALGRRMVAEVGQRDNRGEAPRSIPAGLPGDAKRTVSDSLSWGAVA